MRVPCIGCRADDYSSHMNMKTKWKFEGVRVVSPS